MDSIVRALLGEAVARRVSRVVSRGYASALSHALGSPVRWTSSCVHRLPCYGQPGVSRSRVPLVTVVAFRLEQSGHESVPSRRCRLHEALLLPSLGSDLGSADVGTGAGQHLRTVAGKLVVLVALYASRVFDGTNSNHFSWLGSYRTRMTVEKSDTICVFFLCPLKTDCLIQEQKAFVSREKNRVLWKHEEGEEPWNTWGFGRIETSGEEKERSVVGLSTGLAGFFPLTGAALVLDFLLTNQLAVLECLCRPHDFGATGRTFPSLKPMTVFTLVLLAFLADFGAMFEGLFATICIFCSACLWGTGVTADPDTVTAFVGAQVFLLAKGVVVWKVFATRLTSLGCTLSFSFGFSSVTDDLVAIFCVADGAARGQPRCTSAKSDDTWLVCTAC